MSEWTDTGTDACPVCVLHILVPFEAAGQKRLKIPQDDFSLTHPRLDGHLRSVFPVSSDVLPNPE